MKYLVILGIVSIFIGQSVFAKPDSSLDQTTIRCVFEEPLEIGASVTGRGGESIPFFAHVESYLFGVKNADYKGSPSSFFITHYREMDPLYFTSQRWKKTGVDFQTAPTHWRNIAYPVTYNVSHIGSGQVARMLEGDRRRAFQNASIVVGLDLFYWGAIRDYCNYGNPYYGKLDVHGMRGREFRLDTEYQIVQLIHASKKSGKVLILSTLPFEDPDLVPINSVKTGVPGFWYPQNYGCVNSVNETLRANCKLEDNCYLMDMGKIASELNEGKKVIVESEGKEIGLFESRPDGVHLSRLGSLAVSERMISAFEKNPPHCNPAAREPSGLKKSPKKKLATSPLPPNKAR